MSAEYVREIEDAFGVNPAPRQSARLASDLEAVEPFDEMTGPIGEFYEGRFPTKAPNLATTKPTFRELGIGLFRDGAEEALRLLDSGFTPAEVREWIGRLA